MFRYTVRLYPIIFIKLYVMLMNLLSMCVRVCIYKINVHCNWYVFECSWICTGLFMYICILLYIFLYLRMYVSSNLKDLHQKTLIFIIYYYYYY